MKDANSRPCCLTVEKRVLPDGMELLRKERTEGGSEAFVLISEKSVLVPYE
jgi:hypothetical protein